MVAAFSDRPPNPINKSAGTTLTDRDLIALLSRELRNAAEGVRGEVAAV